MTSRVSAAMRERQARTVANLNVRPSGLSLQQHELSVVAPYRLDLTVSALRRLSTNVVDVFTADGCYVRALAGTHGPVIVRATQVHPKKLVVTLDGDARDGAEYAPLLALVRRVLGVDCDIARFTRAAARLPWLSPLARRMRGVKPPRYPTLWEAFVNAIVFQQVSLQAASTIARRLIVTLGTSLESEGTPLYLFPEAERLLVAGDGELRAMGLSASKIATLRRSGEALVSGALDATMLEERSSHDAAALLQQIKGIGPWTATVILLRGLGRLDVFPMNDTSVAHNIALVAGKGPLDVAGILGALSPQQGMLYYHLLLARLEARGEVGRASVP
jgi:DNA-3-methyladenine glycosylase II